MLIHKLVNQKKKKFIYLDYEFDFKSNIQNDGENSWWTLSKRSLCMLVHRTIRCA